MWNLTFIFLDSHKKFSLVLLQVTNYIYSPWKCKKNVILFILVPGFCPLRIKLFIFLMDSVLCFTFRPHPLKNKGLNLENNLWLKFVQKLPEVMLQHPKSIQYSQKTGFEALIALYFWAVHLPVDLIKERLKERNKWRYITIIHRSGGG